MVSAPRPRAPRPIHDGAKTPKRMSAAFDGPNVTVRPLQAALAEVRREQLLATAPKRPESRRSTRRCTLEGFESDASAGLKGLFRALFRRLLAVR